jgi:hypothetical protein
VDKQNKVDGSARKNKKRIWQLAVCLLEKNLTRANREQKQMLVIEMGRINVELPDELEKKLRFKTIERFGGKKGDLSRAVDDAVKTWISKEK